LTTLDQLLTFLPLISISIAIVYYGMNVRNANRSRQAGLYMQLWNSFRSPDFLRSFNEMVYHYRWDGYADYTEKYGVMNNLDAATKIGTVMVLFESLGRLLKQGFIDVSVIEDQASSAFLALWEKYRPVFEEERKAIDNPRLWNDAEYLYDELKRRGF
jgi:hypothetical protein